MRIFKLRQFDRKAGRLGLDDGRLRQVAVELVEGKFDAVLGGGVFKQRVSLPGRGKSGGARVLVVFPAEERMLFVEVFAKNELNNVSAKTLAAVRDVANFAFAVDEATIATLLEQGAWTELIEDVES